MHIAFLSSCLLAATTFVAEVQGGLPRHCFIATEMRGAWDEDYDVDNYED